VVDERPHDLRLFGPDSFAGPLNHPADGIGLVAQVDRDEFGAFFRVGEQA
jgi:hypothetical protein